MKLVNLTPHAVNIIADDGTVTTIPASGTIARVSVTETPSKLGELAGVPVTRVIYGAPSGLPPYDEEADCLFIVSQIVAAAVKDRPDLVFPGGLVRDEAGNIIGCRHLSIF